MASSGVTTFKMLDEMFPLLGNREKDLVLKNLFSDTQSSVYRTLETKFEAQWDLIKNENSTRKKITVKQNLTFEEKNLLRASYPEYELTFKSDIQATHPYAAASRGLETRILLSKLTQDNDAPIIDIGGNWFSHIKEGRKNIHSCCPILDIRDQVRQNERVMQIKDFAKYRLKTPDQVISKQPKSTRVDETINKYMKNKKKIYCNRPFQECRHKANLAISVHSIYDIDFESFLDSMINRNINTVMASFIFDPSILIMEMGFIHGLNAHFEKRNGKINFTFKDDSSNGYIHDYNNYLKYVLTLNAIRNGHGFQFEMLENRSGIQFLKISKVELDGSYKSTRSLRRIWHSTNEKKVIVKVFDFVNRRSWKKEESLDFEDKVFPEDPVRRMTEYAFKLGDKLTWHDLFNFATSINNRYIINGVEINVPDRIPIDDLTQLVTVIMLKAQFSMWYINNCKDALTRVESKKRIFESDILYKKLWHVLKRTVGSVLKFPVDIISNAISGVFSGESEWADYALAFHEAPICTTIETVVNNYLGTMADDPYALIDSNNDLKNSLLDLMEKKIDREDFVDLSETKPEEKSEETEGEKPKKKVSFQENPVTEVFEYDNDPIIENDLDEIYFAVNCHSCDNVNVPLIDLGDCAIVDEKQVEIQSLDHEITFNSGIDIKPSEVLSVLKFEIRENEQRKVSKNPKPIKVINNLNYNITEFGRVNNNNINKEAKPKPISKAFKKKYYEKVNFDLISLKNDFSILTDDFEESEEYELEIKDYFKKNGPSLIDNHLDINKITIEELDIILSSFDEELLANTKKNSETNLIEQVEHKEKEIKTTQEKREIIDSFSDLKDLIESELISVKGKPKSQLILKEIRKHKNGIFVLIKEGELKMFQPYSFKDFKNKFISTVKYFESAEGFHDQITQFKSKQNEPDSFYEIENWWLNNHIVCNKKYLDEFGVDKMWGNGLLETFKNMLTGTDFKKKNDCFILNKRDSPCYDMDRNILKVMDNKHINVFSTYNSSDALQLNKILPTPSDYEHINHGSLNQTEWKKKKNICFFRGSSTGPGVNSENNQRLRLAKMSETNGLLDCKLTSINRRWQLDGYIMKNQTKSSDYLTASKNNIVDIKDWGSYKFLLNVQGHSAANKLLKLFGTGSVVLNVKHTTTFEKMWFDDYLEPWVNFIPVKEDLSDLDDILLWCLANDDFVKTIAENGKIMYETIANKDYLIEFIRNVLLNEGKNIKTINYKDLNIGKTKHIVSEGRMINYPIKGCFEKEVVEEKEPYSVKMFHLLNENFEPNDDSEIRRFEYINYLKEESKNIEASLKSDFKKTALTKTLHKKNLNTAFKTNGTRLLQKLESNIYIDIVDRKNPDHFFEMGFDGNNLVNLIVKVEENGDVSYIADSNEERIVVNRSSKLVQCGNKLRVFENFQKPLNKNFKNYLVNGVPGCGKTTSIIKSAIEGDIILTVAKETSLEIKAKIDDLEDKHVKVMTVDSFILNNKSAYKRVWLDEGLMICPGEIDIIADLSQCDELWVYGDINQIPFINRVPNFSFKLKEYKFDEVKESMISYRCPADVSAALSKVYNSKMKSTSPINDSINLKTIKKIGDIPKSHEKYLTFSQSEKMELLRRQFKNVNTIHEVQGKTFDDVAVVRINPQRADLYKSQSHAVVGISRHKKTFMYYTVASLQNDALADMANKRKIAEILTKSQDGFFHKLEPTVTEGYKNEDF